MISRPDDIRAQAAASDGGDELASLPALVAEIVETMRKGNLERLEVTRGDFHLALQSFARDTAPRQDGAAAQAARPVPEPNDGEPEDAADRSHTITSPMIGTFYVAPAPGEPPFVRPGDVIEQDQVIGIVEAMKIMNEIASDRAGTVIEILAEDGETVEYGSPLVRLALDS